MTKSQGQPPTMRNRPRTRETRNIYTQTTDHHNRPQLGWAGTGKKRETQGQGKGDQIQDRCVGKNKKEQSYGNTRGNKVTGK